MSGRSLISSRSVEQVAPGEVLGHYRIAEKIGEGGMGEVYRARDEHLGCDVAIKVLPHGAVTDETSRQRFRKEARTLARLNHPNIAIAHDFDTQQGVDYLVMEYIPGATLSEKIAGGSLKEPEVMRLGTQLAEGLAAAHQCGVVHRDLKPGNLRLTADGRLKILDFGLATLCLSPTASTVSESTAVTQGIAGTLSYMAPEQLTGAEVDGRADIHAAGTVLYEMATGKFPFPNEDRSSLIGAILRRPPVPPRDVNPRVSAELERIILKCLEKEPGNRYQSAKELAVDLRRAASTEALGTVPPRGGRTTGLRTLLVSAAVVAGLALALALAFAFNVRGIRARVAGPATPKIESIAVLPLANLGGDPSQEYFVDGMTDELITQLSKVRSLRVISRTSVMRFKNSSASLPEIAKQLHVDAVIEGSVMRSGDRVRINAQLLTANDAHLWADTFDRDLHDVLSLSSEVTRAIAERVRAQLTPLEREQLGQSRAVSEEAYEAYLQGRFLAERGEYKKAAEYFEIAVQKEPEFVSAWYNLAEADDMTNFVEAIYIGRRAREAGDRVMQLAPESAEAYIIRGDERFYREWDWNACEREFGHAVNVAPHNGQALDHYAGCLTALGRYDAARQVLERALEVDPLSPMVYRNLGDNFSRAHQTEQAITYYRRAAELEPENASVYTALGRAYDASGKTAEARAAYLEAIHRSPLSADEARAQEEILQRQGIAALRRHIAEGQLEKLKLQARTSEVSPFLIARWYVALGQNDEAFRYLEEAYRQRVANLAWLATSPVWDPLRSDPRYSSLLRRMKYPGAILRQ